MANHVESDFGITEFLHKHNGFNGVLKMRYEDFLVNEIDSERNVLHFSSLTYDVPEKVQTEALQKESSLDLNLLSQDVQDELIKMKNGSTDIKCVLISAGNDKEQRTQIHQLIRQHYPQFESSTVDQDNEKKIKVFKYDKNNRKRGRQPKEKATLMRFLLFKENISTMDAVNLMMKKLHLKHPKSFQYAGNKDKRAITVQAMTTTLPPKRLLSINSITFNIRIGDFTPCESSLQLGELWGNRFSIALRNIKDANECDIRSAVTSLCEVGFINYFGMQRFGTSSVSTYKIGKALLASKWDEAIDFILSAVTDEEKEVLNLIKSWREEGKASQAFEKLRRKSSFEGFLLRGIAQYGPKQLVQALNRIPRPTRLLYLHSYQSFLWNKIVNERLRLFGDKPVAGDLVLVNRSSPDVIDACENMNDDDNEDPDKKRPKVDSKVTSNSRRSLPEVKVLSEDEVDQYELTGVVLPLPGHLVTYPSNMKEYYVKLLKEDLLSLEVFNHRVKDYSLSGAYRKLVVRPSNVEWDVVRYDDLKTPLFTNDYHKIIGKQDNRDATKTNGRFRALRIHFDLPSSSYATVALRELTKSDMSIPVQSKLGEEHKLQVSSIASQDIPDDGNKG